MNRSLTHKDFLALAATVIMAVALTWSCQPVPVPAAERPVPDWHVTAAIACERRGCDPDLLIAICTHEQDWRLNQSLGDGGLSFGRCQMKATTAARYVLGTTDPRLMTAANYLRVAMMLTDDSQAADLAAQEIVRCARKNRSLEWRLRCWNNDTNYVSRVMRTYTARKVANR